MAKKLTINQSAWKKEETRLKRLIKQAEKRGYKFPADIIPEMPKKITGKALEEIRAIKTPKLYQVAEYKVPETGEIISGIEGRKLEKKSGIKVRNYGKNLAGSKKSTDITKVKAKKEKKPQDKNKKSKQTKAKKSDTKKSTKVQNEKTKQVKTKEVKQPALKEPAKTTENKEEKARKSPDTTAKQAKTGRKKKSDMPIIGVEVLKRVRDIIAEWEPPYGWDSGWAKIKERDKNTLSNLLEGAIAQEGEDTVAQRLEKHAYRVVEIAYEVCYGSDEETIQIELAEFMEIIYDRALTKDEAMDIADAQEYYEGDEET